MSDAFIVKVTNQGMSTMEDVREGRTEELLDEQRISYNNRFLQSIMDSQNDR
jgi:hypothetical protein